ncbi:MAG: hypothetical protein ACREOC_09430 [Gemmatimonadales bacterium]
MRRPLAWVLLVSAGPAAAQQDLGHRFDVTPAVTKAAIADPITLRFSVNLHERDLIADSVPRPTGELPEGVRVLAVQKLTRLSDRALQGEATIAFYRTGAQRVPTFEIPFLRVSANMRGTIKSEPADVEIAPVAPPGNPSLKDLKDLAPVGGIDWLPIGVGAAVLAVGALIVRRWRRRRIKRREPQTIGPSVNPSIDPYEAALARLAALDPRDLPAAADVIRGCLAAAASVPALERTTAELLGALPPRLMQQGNRERLSALLGDADLVKFAQARPPAAAGPAFLGAARALLTSWRAAAQLPPGTADATG